MRLLLAITGILTRATEAKNKTEQAQKDEENILNGYEYKLNEYTGIDWDTVLANAQKHSDQKISTAIGVGTDGRAVNMDLWEYTLLDDGTYGLNDLADMEDKDGTNETKGYLGNIIDGAIEGKVPQYIKASNDKEFIIVSNMKDTFIGIDTLKTTPIIPDTVTDMQSTFSRCSSLINITNLPSNLQNMRYTFLRCTSLEKAPVIPNTVTDMFQTFYYCSNLKEVQNLPTELLIMDSTFEHCTNLQQFEIDIPDKVTSMSWCFNDCTNLSNMDIIIPNSVIDIRGAFSLCPNLSGTIEINANIAKNSDYYSCFANSATNENAIIKLKGTCSVLQEILDETKSFNSHSNLEIVN